MKSLERILGEGRGEWQCNHASTIALLWRTQASESALPPFDCLVPCVQARSVLAPPPRFRPSSSLAYEASSCIGEGGGSGGWEAQDGWAACRLWGRLVNMCCSESVAPPAPLCALSPACFPRALMRALAGLFPTSRTHVFIPRR